MKRFYFIFPCLTLLYAAAAFGLEMEKPDTHNTSWVFLHGKSARIDDARCYECHDEALDCIACHEDTPPRNHNAAWIQKNHGLQSRWNRNSCSACHKEDFCVECHEEALPMNHRGGFGVAGAPGFHCYTSCQLPYNFWSNTPSKNCIVCHKTRPMLKSGVWHQMR